MLPQHSQHLVVTIHSLQSLSRPPLDRQSRSTPEGSDTQRDPECATPGDTANNPWRFPSSSFSPPRRIWEELELSLESSILEAKFFHRGRDGFEGGMLESQKGQKRPKDQKDLRQSGPRRTRIGGPHLATKEYSHAWLTTNNPWRFPSSSFIPPEWRLEVRNLQLDGFSWLFTAFTLAI